MPWAYDHGTLRRLGVCLGGFSGFGSLPYNTMILLLKLSKHIKTGFLEAIICEVKVLSSCSEFFIHVTFPPWSQQFSSQRTVDSLPGDQRHCLQVMVGYSLKCGRQQGKDSVFEICTASIQVQKIFSISRITFHWIFPDICHRDLIFARNLECILVELQFSLQFK